MHLKSCIVRLIPKWNFPFSCHDTRPSLVPRPAPFASYKRICQKLLLNECAASSSNHRNRSQSDRQRHRRRRHAHAVWHAFAATLAVTPTATATATATTASTIEMISLSCQILTSVVIQAVKHFALAVKNRQIREFVEFCQKKTSEQFVEFFGTCGWFFSKNIINCSTL